MPSRYRLLALDASHIADPSSLLSEIWSESSARPHESSAPQWGELVAHINRAGARTLLIQLQVRDPDFIAEYEAVYSKQHRDMQRFCVRVHAFDKDTPESSDEQAVLRFVDETCVQSPSCYLGFVTLRPLRQAPVGASIVVDVQGARSLCKDRFPVHIAGNTFHVVGTPYLQQDSTVGACAQASIWMALRTLRRRSGGAAYSPAELTIAATEFMAFDRVFPGRSGLTVEQMLAAIRASDHDPLVISLRQSDPVTKTGFTNPFEVMERVQPYVESGLPVILLLHHENGGHAVVAIGLAPGAANNMSPPGLLVHNDNQGPYRVLPFSSTEKEYALNQCVSAIVPLPQGVLMPAVEAESQAFNLIQFWIGTVALDPAQAGQGLSNLWVRTYLCTRHAFRKWAKQSTLLDPIAKDLYRTHGMPKLVWVMEIHDGSRFDPQNPGKQTRLGEIVLDAAADALHGDPFVFVRITAPMVKGGANSPGLLAYEEASSLKLTVADPCEGIVEPWDHM